MGLKGHFLKDKLFLFFSFVFWKIEDLEKEVKVLKEIGKICGDNFKLALNGLPVCLCRPFQLVYWDSRETGLVLCRTALWNCSGDAIRSLIG